MEQSPLPTLKMGAKGPFVEQLQQLLKRHNLFAGPIDGIFGKETHAAVMEFQRKRALPEDGIVGPQTWEQLQKTSRETDQSEIFQQKASPETGQGEAMEERQKVEKAQEAELKSDLPSLELARGLIRAGKTREAISMLFEVIRMAESFQDTSTQVKAHIELGKLFETTDASQAERHFQSACEQAGANQDFGSFIEARLNLARMHEKQGQTELAFSEYAEAVDMGRQTWEKDPQVGPQAAQAMQALIDFYHRKKQPENAGELQKELSHLLAVLEKSEQPETETQEPGEATPSGANIRAAPTPKIVSDLWSLEDSLGYSAFARALATLITHPETRPPLTIGLKAPWGAGKTSLMRMVQHYLDGDMEKTSMAEEPASQQQGSVSSIAVDGHWRPYLTYKRLLAFLRDPRRRRLTIRKKENPGAKMGIEARATVWFNAWKYQNSEQIWAGLAHSIISQVTSRLSPQKRELFWLQLHARRLDTDRLRKKIYQVVFESFLPQALSWAGATILLLFIALILPGYYALTPAAATLLPIWAGVRKWRRHAREKLKDQLQGSFRELIRAPNYEGKLGFLHLVESDIREVLDLIATPKEPLVIFIDDLDRCAPRHVAEVVEAINLFLAGDYRNCIFVIGMEPEIVAAALEVANRDLLEKVKEFSILDEQMPLGWRFMEKIIQLPLTLPPPAEEGLAHYIDRLVGQAAHDGESEQRDRADAHDVQSEKMDDQAVDEFAEIFRQEKDIRRVMQKSEELLQEESDPAKKAAAAEASKRVFAEKFDERDPIIREFVYQAATQFHANPRKIKRYINLFRFVSTLRHNYTVDFLRLKGKRPKIPPDDVLTKFVTLSIHWPQSIACLTGSPNGVANGTGQARTSIEKLERKARELAQSRIKPEKLEKEWQAFIEENGLQLGEWILSSSFRQFLARGASFCDYVGCGIW